MSNFPISVDTDGSLFLAVDNLKTILTNNIDASTFTIPVVTTSGFPDIGFVTIPVNTDITLSEKIKYISKTLTEFNAIQRGSGNTLAAGHLAGTDVLHAIVANHHNELKNAIFALEQFVGISGSENFVPQDAFGNVSIAGTTSFGNNITVIGQALVSQLLTAGSGLITGELTVSSGIFIKSLTVSGVPVVTETAVLQSAYDAGDGTITTSVGKPVIITEGAFTQSLTISGIAVNLFPVKGILSFITPIITGKGSNKEIDQSFNTRSLIRKLKVFPEQQAVNSFVIEFFKNGLFGVDKLEYKATASGVYIDNVVWFHEDEDQTSNIHFKLTNNSNTDSKFTVELLAEEFSK